MLGHFGIAFLGLCDKITRHYCDVCITWCLSARASHCTTYVQRMYNRMYNVCMYVYNVCTAVCTTYVQRMYNVEHYAEHFVERTNNNL